MGRYVMRACLLAIAPLTALTVPATYVAAAVSFTKITTGPVVSDGGYSRSIQFIDYDNDGWEDLYVGNGAPTGQTHVLNFLYHNNGDGTFTRVLNDTIAKTTASSDGATWGDFDDDGDLDVYVGTWLNQKNLFFINNGDGTFTRDTTRNIVANTSYSDFAAWADYDQDSFLDLFVSNGFNVLNNYLFDNNGDGTFTKVLSGSIVTDADRSHGSAWGDYDNDGDDDLFVANVGQNNALYTNNGDGTFTKVTTGAIVTDGGFSIRSCWADPDNDGDLDMFVTNSNNQANFFYENNGDGTFIRNTTSAIVQDIGLALAGGWADFDNDADLDLLVTYGFGTSALTNKLFWNNGNGTYTQETTDSVVTDSGWSVGFSFADADKDGDLDLAIARCLNENQDNAYYLNDGNSNHWLSVTLEGSLSNRHGIGARVFAVATVDGSPVRQLREVSSPTGFGQSGLVAWFGLADAATVDSLIVLWPSGTVQVLQNVASDQYLLVRECEAIDPDTDGVTCADNCPSTVNANQEDADVDGLGDACDSWPLDPQNDVDGDSVSGHVDNCPVVSNPGQEDNNTDGIGNACCCVGTSGNVNTLGIVDLADLSLLVAYLTVPAPSKPTLPCPAEANVNTAGIVDLADLSLLVAYLTVPAPGKPALPNCV